MGDKGLPFKNNNLHVCVYICIYVFYLINKAYHHHHHHHHYKELLGGYLIGPLLPSGVRQSFAVMSRWTAHLG